MNILLIEPPSTSYYHRTGSKVLPLGLGYIASSLRQNRHQVKVIDFNVTPIDYSKLDYSSFDLVGISSDTVRIPIALDIATAAKQQGANVVMGGPHPTFLDDQVLKTGAVDYVVRNEGEKIINELCSHLERGKPLEMIKGISYIRDGKVIRNPSAPLIKNLDDLPLPARELFPMDLYTTKLYNWYTAGMITSRGCPFDCEFCSATRFAGVKWRTRSVEGIIDEIKYLYRKYRYRAVQFYDDNFMLDVDRVRRICEGILNKGLNIIWWACARVDSICLLYTSPSPRDLSTSRMPSSA